MCSISHWEWELFSHRWVWAHHVSGFGQHSAVPVITDEPGPQEGACFLLLLRRENMLRLACWRVRRGKSRGHWGLTIPAAVPDTRQSPANFAGLTSRPRDSGAKINMYCYKSLRFCGCLLLSTTVAVGSDTPTYTGIKQGQPLQHLWTN